MRSPLSKATPGLRAILRVPKSFARWADRRAYRVSLLIGRRWLETAAVLLLISVGGAALILFLDPMNWNSVGIFETCFAAMLTIFIFIWTLAGYSVRDLERRRDGAQAFADRIDRFDESTPRLNYGSGSLDDEHRSQLRKVMELQANEPVEPELLMWVIEKPDPKQPVSGGREALVVTSRGWFLRVVKRGGFKVFDLSTGNRLDEI